MGHLHKNYDATGKIINGYDDRLDRSVTIEFLKQVEGDICISNPNTYGDDVKSTINPTLYYEVERGSWFGNHADGNQCDYFGCGFETLKIGRAHV